MDEEKVGKVSAESVVVDVVEGVVVGVVEVGVELKQIEMTAAVEEEEELEMVHRL